MKNSRLRSLTKGLTYRFMSTIATIAISFFVTGCLGASMAIGLTEVIFKVILYYIHERIWLQIK